MQRIVASACSRKWAGRKALVSASTLKVRHTYIGVVLAHIGAKLARGTNYQRWSR